MEDFAVNMINGAPGWAKKILGLVVIIVLITTFIGGIFNVIGSIKNLLKKSKIKIKITESYSSLGKFNSNTGLLYLFNISLVNIGRKDFYPSAWSVKIKYLDTNSSDSVNASVMGLRYYNFKEKDPLGGEVELDRKLKVGDINFINRSLVFRSGELSNGYIFLFVEGLSAEGKKIDHILFTLTSFDDEQIEITSLLKDEDLFFNETIWN